jgi:hypothetical protein
MAVETTGVQTKVNCANPTSQSLNTSGGNFSIIATSNQGCTASVNFSPTISDRQYGVTNVPNCGPITDIEKQDVMFWFFDNAAQGPVAQSVFCSPKIGVLNILATANLTNGSLVHVQVIDDYATGNNVTQPPNSGQAFNGYFVTQHQISNQLMNVFIFSVICNPSTNPFVQARAISTSSGLAGAMFRYASQLPGGLDSTFSNPTGFQDITQRLYVSQTNSNPWCDY